MRGSHRNIVHGLSSAGVAINTCLFGINLFSEQIGWAIISLFCVGIMNNPREENNGD